MLRVTVVNSVIYFSGDDSSCSDRDSNLVLENKCDSHMLGRCGWASLAGQCAKLSKCVSDSLISDESWPQRDELIATHTHAHTQAMHHTSAHINTQTHTTHVHDMVTNKKYIWQSIIYFLTKIYNVHVFMLMLILRESSQGRALNRT